ncbi:hypothetical protein E2651_35805 [Streptomyces sp. MZ04]|nr:hypothetical protein [Streptomyces sp. MZ04]TGA93677.1 hypothetical protein E2651_35805 [Streptomyces sp. MZ04]
MSQTQRTWSAPVAERGEAPTIREIGRSVGLSSPASVAYHLAQMEQVGVIPLHREAWFRAGYRSALGTAAPVNRGLLAGRFGHAEQLSRPSVCISCPPHRDV